MSKLLTAEEAFKHSVVTLDAVADFMSNAPIEGKEVVPYHVYVAAYFMGCAIAAMQQSKPELAERTMHDVTTELMGLIVDVLKKQNIH